MAKTKTQETTGGDRGKKRSTEEKMDDKGDELQGVLYRLIHARLKQKLIIYLYIIIGGPKAKKAKLVTDTGSTVAETAPGK